MSDSRGSMSTQEDISFNLGQQVIQARKLAGLTQAQLAKKAKTTQSSIARVESGDVANMRHFLRLIKACNCRIDFCLLLKEVE